MPAVAFTTQKTTATSQLKRTTPVPRLRHRLRLHQHRRRRRVYPHPADSSNKQVFIVYRRVFFSLLIYAHTTAHTHAHTHLHAYIHINKPNMKHKLKNE